MTAKALAQVLLRVWGVILIVSAAIWMTAAFVFAPGAWRLTVIPAVMRLLVELAAGLTLIRNGDRIGAWLVSDIEEEGPPADGVRIQAIGFAILGAWFLINGLADLLGRAVFFFSAPEWNEGIPLASLREKQMEALVMGAAKGLAGAILLFRRVDLATRISRIWRTVRREDDDVPGG